MSSSSSPGGRRLEASIEFLTNLIRLVELERDAESTESELLLGNTPLNLLVKSGLALNNLTAHTSSKGGRGVSVGFTGHKMVELSKHSAVGGGRFGPHDFRVGDLAKIITIARSPSTTTTRTKAKRGGTAKPPPRKKKNEDERGTEAVVYKVSNEKITLVLNKSSTSRGRGANGDDDNDDDDDDDEGAIDWDSDKITLIKVSNPSTFKRQIHFLRRAIRTIEACRPSQSLTTAGESDAVKSQRQPQRVDKTGSSSSSSSEYEDENEDESDGRTTERIETKEQTAVSEEEDDPAIIRGGGSSNSCSGADHVENDKGGNTFARCRRGKDEADEVVVPPLLSVLLGLTSPTTTTTLKDDYDDDDDDERARGETEWFDPLLNPSQKEAVEFALASNEIAAIWGPPGTGKTQTLVEIIRQLVLRRNLRVLVCGASNLSVDNILARLSSSSSSRASSSLSSSSSRFPTIPLTRLGHPARILSSLTTDTLEHQSLATDQHSLVADIRNELIEREHALANRDKKTRVRGSDRRRQWDEVRELRRDLRRRFNSIERDVLSDKRVVLSTTHGAGAKVLDKLEFDVVIIDEAAQATEPACWIPIMRGKKLILAGDHLQLPPTLKSSPSPSNKNKNKHSLETTLFSRMLSLHGEPIRKMLTVQYRFNDKINEFPSRMLYRNRLEPDSSVKDLKLGDLLLPPPLGSGSESESGGRRGSGDEDGDDGGGAADLEDLNEPIVFFDTAGLAMYERSGRDEGEGGGGGGGKGGYGSESKSNENEADIVLNYVKFLVESKVPQKSISIISPYASQVSLLSLVVHPEFPEVEIGSIDSNQGRENDVVIISLVRSNETGQVGFLKESRRLNVAMTRPRRQLVVVGDSDTLKKEEQQQSSSSSSFGRADSSSHDEEEEEKSKGSTSVTQQDDNNEDERKKKKNRQVAMGGREYLKAWIQWLEENAYVRVP